MSKFRMAILDDNELYVHYSSEKIKGGVTRLLPNLDLSISTFIDPAHFIFKFSQCHFDLVLIDQSMPGLKGSDVVSKLKKSLSNTLFFFVTDFEDDQILEEIIKVPNVVGVYPKSKFLDENIIRMIPILVKEKKSKSSRNRLIITLITLLILLSIVIFAFFTIM